MSLCLQKFIVVCPELDQKGGVANYYRTLESEFGADLNLYQIRVGRRGGMFATLLWQLCNYVGFLRRIVGGIDAVVLNPSFQRNALARDALYLIISKLMLKKVVVIFHGWDIHFEDEIRESSWLNWFICFAFAKSDKILCLADDFIEKIRSIFGVNEVFLTRTFCDSSRFPGVPVDHDWTTFRYIYISRIEPNKGALEAIKLYELIAQKGLGTIFYVCGEGSELPTCKAYAASAGMDDVVFTGHLDGQAKRDVFRQTNVALFPTTYGEGMPICLVESMASSQYIITTRVGGIPDLLKDTNNILLNRDDSVAQWAECISEQLRKETAASQAKENFHLYAARHQPRKVFFEALEGVV